MADESRFDDVRLGPGWSWDDEPYYYSAQVSGLNLNENVIQVVVRPGRKSGLPVVVNITPPTRYAQIRNQCITAPSGSKNSAKITRMHGANLIMVSGKVPADCEPKASEERIAVESPAEYAATVFKELLGRRRILVMGSVGVGKLPADARLLKLHESAPLSDVLPLLNKPSDNLIAEALLKTLGVETGRAGSWPDGVMAVLSFLQKCGVDASSVAVADGSGLSRLNYISPHAIVKTLRYMAESPDGQVFADSLPVAGVDGTLARRMTGTVAQWNVRAKTGYVMHVSALSGYLTAASGDRFAFSIILNNHLCANRRATAAQDDICEILVREL